MIYGDLIEFHPSAEGLDSKLRMLVRVKDVVQVIEREGGGCDVWLRLGKRGIEREPIFDDYQTVVNQLAGLPETT